MRIHIAIISITLLITTLLTLMLTYYLVDLERSSSMSDLRETIKRNNELIRLVNQTPMYNFDLDSLEKNLDSFFKDQNMVSIELRDYEGDISIKRSRTVSETPGSTRIESKAVIAVQDLVRNLPLGEVTTIYTTALIEKRLAQSRNKHLLFSLALLATASFTLYFLIRIFTAPIDKLTRVADEITAGNLDIDVNIRGLSELKKLGHSFDTMKGAIKEKINALEQEISTRIQAENENTYLRNLLKNTFDSMPSILVGVDYNGKITQWNKHAARHTSIFPQKAIGRLFSDLLHYPVKLQTIQGAIDNKKPVKQSKVMVGDHQFFDITIYPLMDGIIREAVIRIDEVTNRVQMEELMIQSEKMLSIGGLAAGMAHEINNPLAGIIQNIQVITNRIKPETLKNQEVAKEVGINLELLNSYLEKREILKLYQSTLDASLRAAKIVQNMLEFSRKSDRQHTSVNIAELMDKTLDLVINDFNLKKHFDFRQIKIVRNYDERCGEIFCNEIKLQQVFFNLLYNGAQAMESYTVDNEQPTFVISMQRDAKTLEIQFEDNGAGMDSITSKRVFEPFFTTKDTGKGIGLGLSVSYFIITDEHQGNMLVQSTPGKGTVFTIHLPLEVQNGQVIKDHDWNSQRSNL